ncbi:hypothetical protein BG000_006555, partial [Podila horticola]
PALSLLPISCGHKSPTSPNRLEPSVSVWRTGTKVWPEQRTKVTSSPLQRNLLNASRRNKLSKRHSTTTTTTATITTTTGTITNKATRPRETTPTTTRATTVSSNRGTTTTIIAATTTLALNTTPNSQTREMGTPAEPAAGAARVADQRNDS